MNKSIKLIVNYVLGPLLFVVLAYTLYKQIVNQPDLNLRWAQIKMSWQNSLFWIVVVLMFLNWGIEALKLKYLLSHLEKLSFWKSLQSVFAGSSITMLTPNRTGEFGGRILFVSEKNRIKAISANIMGSISQLVVTIFLGTLSLFYFLFVLKQQTIALPWFFNTTFFYAGLLITFFLLLFYFKIHYFIVIINRIPFLRRFIKHIDVVDSFTSKELLGVISLSLIRYSVFIFQYLLMLKVMQVNIDLKLALLLLMVFYFIMALAPTIGFTELPIRATASVLVLGIYSNNTFGIQVAAFAIWIINLVIPAIIGGLFISTIKIVKEHEHN